MSRVCAFNSIKINQSLIPMHVSAYINHFSLHYVCMWHSYLWKFRRCPWISLLEKLYTPNENCEDQLFHLQYDMQIERLDEKQLTGLPKWEGKTRQGKADLVAITTIIVWFVAFAFIRLNLQTLKKADIRHIFRSYFISHPFILGLLSQSQAKYG